MPAIMLPMSRFLFFHGLVISLPPAKVLLFPDIRKCFMLFAQISEDENAKSNLFRVFEHESNELHEFCFRYRFSLGCLFGCRGQSPIPKKSLPKSNELLRMLVRIFVLDYCSQKLFVRFV